jgi:hypothetical protein
MMQKDIPNTVIDALIFSRLSRGADPELWIKSLSIDDGLSESSVQCILQDRKG